MGILGVNVLYLLIALVQIECPQAGDFGSIAPSTISVRAATPDAVWSRVRSRLQDWYVKDFAPPPAKRLGELSSVELQSADQPMMQQGQPAGQWGARLTCFVAKRSGSLDQRMAFMFALQREKRAGTALLEIRWLGQAKGRGERTWHQESAQSATFAEKLIARLGAP